MSRLTFSIEEQQVLHRERFEHPHPRVQQRMEVLWLISQGETYAQAARWPKSLKRRWSATWRSIVKAVSKRCVNSNGANPPPAN